MIVYLAVRGDDMNTRKLTVTAVSAGLSTFFLYLCSITPSGKLALIALASACVCVPVIECGTRYAASGAVAAILLSFIIIPNKMIPMAYAMLFGYYPIVKLYIERIRRLWMEMLIKLAGALLVIGLAFLLFRAAAESIVYPVSAVVTAALAVFVIYDAALTMFISFYKNRISKHIKRK